MMAPAKSHERRRMRRHRVIFKNIEERNRFLSDKFPNLKLEKAGVYRLEHGGKLSVWLHTVIWTEPHT